MFEEPLIRVLSGCWLLLYHTPKTSMRVCMILWKSRCATQLNLVRAPLRRAGIFRKLSSYRDSPKLQSAPCLLYRVQFQRSLGSGTWRGTTGGKFSIYSARQHALRAMVRTSAIDSTVFSTGEESCSVCRLLPPSRYAFFKTVQKARNDSTRYKIIICFQQ